MHKFITVGLLVIMVAVSAAACGSGTSPTTDTSTPATAAPTTPAPTASPADASGSETSAAAGVGDTIALQGWDGVAKIEVTVKDTKRLPKVIDDYGDELHPALYGVLLSIQNVGDAPYADNSIRSTALIDAQDISHGSSFRMEGDGSGLEDLLSDYSISPGDKRAGWVYFDLKPNREVRLFQFTADSGNQGPGMNVGEWQVQ